MIGLLNKRCSTQRPVVTNGALGVSRSFPEGYHLEDVPCALQQRSAKELSSVTEGLTSMVAGHKLWFEIGTDIAKTDRVIVEGVTFEVTVVNPDVAGVGHHGDAELLEVRA